jgi:hypothetical protein
MRRFLSLALLALTLPLMATGQKANDTPADHGTPQGAQTPDNTAKPPAKPKTSHKKPASKPAATTRSLDGTPQTDIHGTPQDSTQK